MSATKKVLTNGSFSIAAVIVKWAYICHRRGHSQERQLWTTLERTQTSLERNFSILAIDQTSHMEAKCT